MQGQICTHEDRCARTSVKAQVSLHTQAKAFVGQRGRDTGCHVSGAGRQVSEGRGRSCAFKAPRRWRVLTSLCGYVTGRGRKVRGAGSGSRPLRSSPADGLGPARQRRPGLGRRRRVPTRPPARPRERSSALAGRWFFGGAFPRRRRPGRP